MHETPSEKLGRESDADDFFAELQERHAELLTMKYSAKQILAGLLILAALGCTNYWLFDTLAGINYLEWFLDRAPFLAYSGEIGHPFRDDTGHLIGA